MRKQIKFDKIHKLHYQTNKSMVIKVCLYLINQIHPETYKLKIHIGEGRLPLDVRQFKKGLSPILMVTFKLLHMTINICMMNKQCSFKML